jgi:hypothetical protein
MGLKGPRFGIVKAPAYDQVQTAHKLEFVASPSIVVPQKRCPQR